MIDEKTRKDLEWLYSVAKPDTFGKFDGRDYDDRVPAGLIAIWERYGLASWADGAYQNIDPEFYTDLIQQALPKACKLDTRSMVPFVLTAFGQILAWEADLGVINFDLQCGKAVIERDPALTKLRKPGDIELSLGFSTHKPDQYNYGIFTKARERFGKLSKDEMYYFESAPCLGGSFSIDNISRGNAQVHWDLLHNICEMRTFYYRGRFPDMELVPFD